MHQPRRLRLTASIMLCFVLQALGADKYTDENRPYEFGFKIDGEQHRHESKDKDGIIMGEFGFVTADDVYHVTVYATDKEGRFKILSMKNIHLKSSSTSSLGAPIQTRQGHALALPQGSVASQPGGPSKPVSIEPPGKACSSCSLPTTTPRAPPPAYNQVPDNNNYNGPNQFDVPGLGPQNQQVFPPSSPGQLNIAQGGPSGSSYSPQGSQQNYPSGQQNIPEQGFVAPGGAPSFALQPGQIAQNYPGSPSYAQGPGSPNAPNNYALGGGSVATVPHSGNYGQNNIDQAGLSGPNSQPSGQSFYPQGEAGDRTAKQYNSPEQQFDSNLGPQGLGAAQGGQRGPDKPTLSQPSGQSFYPQGGAGDRTAKQYNGPEQQFDSNFGPQGPGAAQGGQRGPDKPTLFSAQMQIVDKNTDVNALGPNEQRGLPPGLTRGDMTQLLYTFNYTLGFHGHFEEGYTNGVKQGYYFITGRNGVRTRIDYVADDTGFHPKVSQDVLDLLSEDVPKPETEKDDKYGLKGYEFKWLYYPVESKKR